MKTSKSRLNTSSVTIVQEVLCKPAKWCWAVPALSPEVRFTACNFLPDVDEYITQMVDKSSDEQKVAQWTRGRSNKDTGVAMMRTPRSTRTAIIDKCLRDRRDVSRHHEHVLANAVDRSNVGG
jgi:hypothetical protein